MPTPLPRPRITPLLHIFIYSFAAAFPLLARVLTLDSTSFAAAIGTLATSAASSLLSAVTASVFFATTALVSCTLGPGRRSETTAFERQLHPLKTRERRGRTDSHHSNEGSEDGSRRSSSVRQRLERSDGVDDSEVDKLLELEFGPVERRRAVVGLLACVDGSGEGLRSCLENVLESLLDDKGLGGEERGVGLGVADVDLRSPSGRRFRKREREAYVVEEDVLGHGPELDSDSGDGVKVGRSKVLKVVRVPSEARVSTILLGPHSPATHATFLGTQTPLYSGLSIREANHLPL